MFYSWLRPLLFTLNPEFIHEQALGFFQASGKFKSICSMLSLCFEYESPLLQVNVNGLEVPNIVGLAAGFDKNGVAASFLQELGFGFLEVGTVTPLGQPGNPKPRIFRLPKDQAIINRLGFNNHGVNELMKNLAMCQRKIPIGINLGKNKNTSLELAISDYTRSLRIGWESGDYFTINVSSPNTEGLRQLQEELTLYELIRGIKQTSDELASNHGQSKPIWLKIAPDLSDRQLEIIAQVALSLEIDAIVVTNTTIEHTHLTNKIQKEKGGLSGAPLRLLSTSILQKMYRYTQGKIPLVGVGGIFNAEDAFQKIVSGASLIQIYTGFIYNGPTIVKDIKMGLVKILEEKGFRIILEDYLRKSFFKTIC